MLKCPAIEALAAGKMDVELATALEFADCSLSIDHDGIRIGSSVVCDIQLAEGPALNSIVRAEEGVIWIEADIDCNQLVVNGRSCRRMALRDGDVISVPGVEITVRQRPASSIEDDAADLVGEISRLTAEELCDRILSEQSSVDEFELGRLAGWHKLMSAIKATHYQLATQAAESTSLESTQDYERLLEQIHDMSEMMNGRTEELDNCESELVAATSLLQETQDRVSRQIEELLDQIGDTTQPGELRVSA